MSKLCDEQTGRLPTQSILGKTGTKNFSDALLIQRDADTMDTTNSASYMLETRETCSLWARDLAVLRAARYPTLCGIGFQTRCYAAAAGTGRRCKHSSLGMPLFFSFLFVCCFSTPQCASCESQMGRPLRKVPLGRTARQRTLPSESPPHHQHSTRVDSVAFFETLSNQLFSPSMMPEYGGAFRRAIGKLPAGTHNSSGVTSNAGLQVEETVERVQRRHPESRLPFLKKTKVVATQTRTSRRHNAYTANRSQNGVALLRRTADHCTRIFFRRSKTHGRRHRTSHERGSALLLPLFCGVSIGAANRLYKLGNPFGRRPSMSRSS